MSTTFLSRWRTRRHAPAPPRLTGGLALARDKPGLDRGIVTVPVPKTLVLPLVGHGGRALVPAVSIGQRVARGEALAPGLLASADAVVVGIEPRPIAHPAGRLAPCVVLETDEVVRCLDVSGESVRSATGTGAFRAADRKADVGRNDDPRAGIAVSPEPLRPTLPALDALTRERLVACAVTGLGGAGFPTPGKLADAPVHTVLVNGAECEPGIACDEALMRVAAAEIVAGGVDLARLVGATRCLLAVEVDKRGARAALREAVDARATDGGDLALRLVDIAPVYPSGAERLLIRLATGIDVPIGERPSAHGVLCVNVATARAAHRARLGEPLLSRVVTVAGAHARAPCNARVAFGTPFADVLDATAQGPRTPATRRRTGGPLSGFDVADEAVPVTATVNRIALEPPLAAPASSPCIRCAACSDVCPVGLLPQELLRHVRADADTADADPAATGASRAGSIHQAALDRGRLDACLECGCCDLVCPSSIALTATFRHARGARLDARRRERDATRAEALYRRREARRAAGGAAGGSVNAADHARTTGLVDGANVVHEGTDAARGGAGTNGGDRHARNEPTGAPAAPGLAPAVVTARESADADDAVAAALARARERRHRRRSSGGAGSDREDDGVGDEAHGR